jgi:hypothetical protein
MALRLERMMVQKEPGSPVYWEHSLVIRSFPVRWEADAEAGRNKIVKAIRHAARTGTDRVGIREVFINLLGDIEVSLLAACCGSNGDCLGPTGRRLSFAGAS